MLSLLEDLGLDPRSVGVVVVDHGSRREESNQQLLEVAARFQQISSLPIVEPAHMEIAEPTIAQAFARCVEQGATTVVVFPYFLGPGRHSREDIPALADAAARQHAGVRHFVAEPLGIDEMMAQMMQKRIEACLKDSLNSGSNG